MVTRRLGAILALGLALVVAACSPGPGAGGQLEGTKWVLDAFGDDGQLTIVDEGLYADASFAAHRVRGFAGCNEYDALYRAGGRTLIVSSPSTTLMACDEASMAFEQAYLGLLTQSRHYTVRRDTLTVYDADRNTILRFDAAPRNPLLGTWSVEAFESEPSTVSSVLEGSKLQVAFRIGSLGGFAGCNSFSGVYGTNGSVVRVGRLATTMLACDEDVMAQEAAFLSALEGAAVIEPRGDRLNLTDRNGSIKVALVRPATEEEPSPDASGEPTATPTDEPTEEPSPEATAATPAPTATPTPAPTPAPTASPTAPPAVTPSPSAEPPASTPPAASCTLAPVGGDPVATIAYPGSWFTLDAPPEAACRFFDPEEIEVPSGGGAPTTAVYAATLGDPYADAIAAATDPATWRVTASSEVEVDGVPVTCVDAVALVDTTRVAAGQARYLCLADVGAAGSIAIGSVGTPGDEVFIANAAVASLMTLASTFEAGS